MFAVIILLCVYFTPTLVVLCNDGAPWDKKAAIFFLNLVFGWTILGLIIVCGLAQVDYKGAARVANARANFYLREDEKYRASQDA